MCGYPENSGRSMVNREKLGRPKMTGLPRTAGLVP